MTDIVWIEGRWAGLEEAKIPVYDRGLLLGDGVFESMRADNGYIFALKDHIDRLFKGLEILKITPNYDKKQLIDVVETGVKKSKLKKAYIRITVTRGDGFGLLPKISKSRIIIIIKKLEDEKLENGIDVIISKIRRPSIKTGLPNIKSLNYLPSILAKLEAEKNKVQDALLLNQDEYVIEATTSNIFFVKNDEIFYPSVDLGILEGITMKYIIKIAEKIGFNISEIAIKEKDLINFDEVFLTNSVRGIISVKTIENIELKNDFKVANRIRNEFSKYLKNQ